MSRSFVIPIIFSLLLMGVVACTTESAPATATNPPPATATDAPTPSVAPPTPSVAAPTEPPATSVPSIQAFEDQLAQALQRRDAAQLQGLMGDTFMIAGWRSEGMAYAPDAAVEQLLSNYLRQETTPVLDVNKDLAALLDGMDPLAILGPDVREPRAVFASSWGPEGQDGAILYIAHGADGVPYWYGVLHGFGASGEVPETGTVLALPEADMAVRLPPGLMLMKNTELYRRGSFAAYNFVSLTGFEYPYLAEIQFFSRESIESFVSRCAGGEAPCFFGDYPDVRRYEGQKAAFEQGQDYEAYSAQDFNGRRYLVGQHACEGVLCVVREYTTFSGGTKVDAWVMMADATQAPQADALFAQVVIQDDWAGIGSMPGPLYTLLDPGLTLRYPLNWNVREETAGEGDFVVRSVSFIPPVFAESDQPQVPAINLFVYDRPLDDTLQAWLGSYATDAPFGSDAGPETHFFRVRETNEIRSASFLGLRFTHDVLGLPAHELLFAVGRTVVGLSYVDFGPEELRSDFMQMWSSLAVASATPGTERTDVSAILVMDDISMYRGPGETYQGIGQVMEGQVALVTGLSEDGGWWRVICPNDTISDCWVSADSLLTQPTDGPGADPARVSTWVAYRDERNGYGLAVPCHWILQPPPLEGFFPTLTVRSYDDEFRTNNSVKGEWVDGKWPTGAMKMDVTVIEEVAADEGLAEYVSAFLLKAESVTVESAQEITVGSQPAVAVVTARSDNPSDRHTTIAFRIAPEKILMVNVLPEDGWRSGDVQGILSSIALTSEQEITMPEYPPAPALIDVPEACIR